jgi:hypothetical protein
MRRKTDEVISEFRWMSKNSCGRQAAPISHSPAGSDPGSVSGAPASPWEGMPLVG